MVAYNREPSEGMEFTQDVIRIANSEIMRTWNPTATEDERISAAIFALTIPYVNGQKELREAYLKDNAEILAAYVVGKV